MVALGVLGVVGSRLPVLLALALVTMVVIALVTFETITHAEARGDLRHQHHLAPEAAG